MNVLNDSSVRLSNSEWIPLDSKWIHEFSDRRMLPESNLNFEFRVRTSGRGKSVIYRRDECGGSIH